MKSRLSYFLISVIIILSIFTGTFILRSKHLNQITTFNKNPYNPPTSSKYIPINSDIVIHWKLNPTFLPKYIESYQDQVNKNIINNKISFIRDSSFKLISLDFAKDISNWVGDYGSFAVVNTNEKLLNDWIMVLEIKDDINIEDKLESFSDSKNLDANIKSTNSLSKSRGEIISKKISSNYSIYIAKKNNNILIASNPKIIKSSIADSDNDKLNNKGNYKYIQMKDNLNDGFLLLEISPKNISTTIGQKENILSLNDTKKLISSINIDKNKLILEGILSFDIKAEMPFKKIYYNFNEIIKESKSYEDFILVDNPNQYFRKDLNHPYQKLIASLIQESATSDYSNLFKIILKKSKGNLLWINNTEWFILTRKSDTRKNEISDILKQEKFLSSILDLKDRRLEIWSKISTDGNENYEIKESIEAIIEEGEDTYLWSQKSPSISIVDNINYLQGYSDKKDKVDKIDDFNDILRIHLGEKKTKTVLNNFYPYILLRTSLGNKVNPPLSIDISIAVPEINYPDFIKFQINLKTS